MSEREKYIKDLFVKIIDRNNADDYFLSGIDLAKQPQITLRRSQMPNEGWSEMFKGHMPVEDLFSEYLSGSIYVSLNEKINNMTRPAPEIIVDEKTVPHVCGADGKERPYDPQSDGENPLRIKGSYMILGTYCAQTDTITIYTQAIELSAEHAGVPFEAAAEAVLVHETFHAVHYYTISMCRPDALTFWNEQDKLWKGIKESLAAYVEYKCLEKLGKRDGKDYTPLVTELVEDQKYPDFPYAGVKELLDHDDITSFADVWALSVSEYALV